MTTDQATPQPTPPAGNKIAIKYIIIAVAGLSIFGCLAVSCLSIAAFAFLRSKESPVVNGKAAEHWGFQDLQDHLAGKGLKTSRGPGFADGRSGMWFVKGDGQPLKGGQFFVPGGSVKRAYEQGSFFVQDLSTPLNAKSHATSRKDIEQRDDILVWGRFIIYASPETRESLKGMLQ